tara:strand:- start:437 stop:739 length:303 start_codon:yes stop_codon:yes gene_type:complete
MTYKKILKIIIIFLFLNSCGALVGNKRSDKSDEFLVEKKKPLTMPPDIDQLPVPTEEENSNILKEDKDEIKKILGLEQSENNEPKSNKNLEVSIIEKINN